MAVDFRQELRWKLEASKQTAYACITARSHCKTSSLTSTSFSSMGSTVSNTAISLCTQESLQQARSVAKSLSHSISTYWSTLATSIHSDSSSTTTRTEVVESAVSGPAGDCRELTKRTDQILALPLQLSAELEANRAMIEEGSLAATADKLKANKSKSKSDSSITLLVGAVEATSHTLLAHQTTAIQLSLIHI